MMMMRLPSIGTRTPNGRKRTTAPTMMTMTMRIKWLITLAMLALGGCTATAGLGQQGAGVLGGIAGGLSSGGSLTPITNLGNALTLQELANSHNTIYEAQQILNASGLVTVATPPAVIVTPAPTPTPTPPPGPLPTGPTNNG